MLTIANVLAGLIGAGIIFLGARFVLAPSKAAAGFGVATEDPRAQAWLPVKGVRDMASGIFLFILMIAATPQVLGWFMLAAACIPVGDALIVLRNNGPKSAAYGIHGATAVVMLAISVLLLVA